MGRVPYLVPARWEDGWPVLGVDGKVPETLNLPASKGPIPGIVTSDEFARHQKSLRPPPRMSLSASWKCGDDSANSRPTCSTYSS